MSANLREPRLPRLDSCFIIVVIKAEKNYDVNKLEGTKITKVRFMLYHRGYQSGEQLGHSGQIGNMRHSGTLKTQNCQYEKLWKYYWLFSCSYHTRWEKNNGQAYLTHRVHVVRVFENLMSRNDEMKVWSSPGLETHLFLSHVDCISSITMTQIKKIFFLQFLTYVPS